MDWASEKGTVQVMMKYNLFISILLLVLAPACLQAQLSGTEENNSAYSEDIALIVTLQGREAALLWQMNSGIFTYITGFYVERRSGLQGEWVQLGWVTEGLCTTGACSWQYSDSELPEDGNDIYYRLQVYQLGAEPWYTRDVLLETSSLPPSTIGLSQSYPNPLTVSNGSTIAVIRYRIPEPVHVTLRVWDSRGKIVTVLVDDLLRAGTYSAAFDAEGLSPGVYFYQLRAAGQNVTKRLLVQR